MHRHEMEIVEDEKEAVVYQRDTEQDQEGNVVSSSADGPEVIHKHNADDEEGEKE